jgi:hypothetical protein
MLSQWLVGEKEEVAGPSSVLVSGLDAEYNGVYAYDGDINGKPSYRLNEDVDLNWNGDSWNLVDGESVANAASVSDVPYPWLATGWFDEGINPENLVVTEIPAANPISNYYTLPERYLWAKIAVAAGCPKTEADYISLPKQYVWSDIYNAISGDIAQSTVVVSGLSDTQYNGRYVYDGNLDGGPSYRLDENVSIFWFENNVWVLVDTDSVLNMSSVSDVAYPWLATGWVDEGIDPTGLVLTAETPNHTDWSEKQALGHIAAAYRGDTANPANLATYIDWPWRYQVASIITSL